MQFLGRVATLQLRPDLHSSKTDDPESPGRLGMDVCLLVVTGRDQLNL